MELPVLLWPLQRN